MACSPPTSKVDELCRYILHATPDEPAQCFGRRQVQGEAGPAEEAADDWLEEDEILVIEFPHPESDQGKRKKKTPSIGRFPVLTSIGSSEHFGGREMAPSALLPISARRSPSGTPLSGAKRRLSSGSSAYGRTKFKIVRKDPTTYKELPKLSHEDVNTGLLSPTEPFATGQTTADFITSNSPASPIPCPIPSYHPSSCPSTSRGMPRTPQTENPDSSGYCTVRVTVLAPELNERLSSKCKVTLNSVCVKPNFWFRLQFESSDPHNIEARVFAHYVHNGAPQTPLVSCDKDYKRHERECDVCASRKSDDRPFLCSGNARFPVYPSEHVGGAREAEAPFTPLDSFVSSADPNKVTLQMTAICLNSCGHHNKRKVTLLVEARQRDDTTAFPQVETFTFAIRCCESPTRDSNPKRLKSIQNTPSNNPSISTALFFPSPPQHLPGLCPNTPPSACLSPDELDDSPMLSFAAASPPLFSPSHEIHLGEFDAVTPLQGSLKTEPCALLLRTNSHHLPLVPGDNKPNFNLPPPGSISNYYSLEVTAADLVTLDRYRDFFHSINIKTLPGYKVHVP